MIPENSVNAPKQQQPKENQGEHEDIWSSGFETKAGAFASPPPMQLTANAAEPLGQVVQRKGGLTPEQMALIASFGMQGAVSQLSEAEQTNLATFLEGFQLYSQASFGPSGGIERTYQAEGQGMQLAIEQLPGNQVKKTVHYYKGSFQFHHETIETQADGPEGAASENEEALTVELPTTFTESVFVPGKGIVSVGTDDLFKTEASTPIGVEAATPTLDRHLRYRREIEVKTADGREILIQVVGRTNLAKGNKDAASLAIKGDSQLEMRMLVKRWDGATSFEESFGKGNSLNEAIPTCAADGNFAELLLQPGTPDEAFLDAAIAKANTLLPALGKPEREDKKQIGTFEQEEGDPNSVKTDKQLANPEIVDPIGHAEKKPELIPWNEMTMEEKREEAWETFKEAFSWTELLMEILAGVAMMLIAIIGVKMIGPAMMVFLGGLAIAMGLWTIIAPYLDGKSTSVVEWIKGGLLIIGGAALIVSAVVTSPGWAPVAGGIALTAFLLYAIVELINSKMIYEEAIVAPTREEMQTKVKASAVEAKNGVRDLTLGFMTGKKMDKGVDALLEPFTKGGTSPTESIFANEESGGLGAASADEAVPKQVEEPMAAKEEEALIPKKEEIEEVGGIQKPTPSPQMDDVYLIQKGIVDQVKNGTITLKNRRQKGNFGEMDVDVALTEIGLKPLGRRITDLDAHTEHGIDHVYFKEGPPPLTLVVESKFGTSKLSKLADGTRQMSDVWIEARLRAAVGERKSTEILNTGYESVLAKVDGGGNITYLLLDASGKVVGKFNP
ncbi:MAG: DUF308 domain-containing protein [Bacteroidetes bacterium]|nr:DUF308 domain-containing protein [Bacteroidota bacterium]MBP6721108.1 DUF308 domain-containing protein [Bacteroidia bacterium]MBP8073382.1 DUF308 domain-containing protein [Bacteroidia bacterium]